MNYIINNQVITSKDNEEIVILNMDNGNFYGLDEMGTEVWNLLQQKVSLDGIVNYLINKYDVSLIQLEKDIHQFIESLVRFGLVKVDG